MDVDPVREARGHPTQLGSYRDLFLKWPSRINLRVNETFDLGSTRLRVVLADPVATVLEGELDPGGGSTWHTHHREDEIVIVLAGHLVVDDGERHELRPGDAYALPRGVCHAFANESDSLTRLYFFCSPGGLERFFRDLISGVPPAEAALRADLVFE